MDFYTEASALGQPIRFRGVVCAMDRENQGFLAPIPFHCCIFGPENCFMFMLDAGLNIKQVGFDD